MIDPENNEIVPIHPVRMTLEDGIKELIYETWLFLADRSAPRALKIVTEQLHDVSPDTLPFTEEMLPSLRTVQRWVKTENWNQRANDHIRKTAKHIDENQISRLFILADKAIQWADRLLEGDFDRQSPGILAVKATIVKEMLQFRGLGTAGAVGAPSLEVNITTSQSAEIDTMTADERAAMQRDAILKNKERRRLTGHVK